MLATIHLFARLREDLGGPVLTLECSNGLTVGQLRGLLLQQFPHVQLLKSCRVAVNQEFVDDEHIIEVGDEIGLIPPVSGG